jgi:hypothetical protein
MSKRNSRERVLNQSGGYWVRSKHNSTGGRRRSVRESSPPSRPRAESDMIIVEDADHGKIVYHAPPPARPRPTRERSYSESRLPPRRAVECPRRRDREVEVGETSPSLPRRRQKPSPSPSPSPDSSPPPQRREKSPRRRRVTFSEPAIVVGEPRRKSEAPSARASAPPPPPPYQPAGYALAAQPYYGQPMMEAPRQGNAASRLGKKLGNAAIFGVGFTAGADLVNSII